MKAAAIRLVQECLIDEGFSPGTVDGKLGKNTYWAVGEALEKRKADLPDDWVEWPDRRKTVAYIQFLCKERDIEVGNIDGYWGHQTEDAFDDLAYLLKHGELPPPWRDEEPLDLNPNNWPKESEPELIAFYGQMEENQVRLALPYSHRLAWDLTKTINSFSCHAKVHDSAERVLQRVLDHYGMERIKELRLDRWGGCLNKRKMRGGSRWSMHSWGIAMDYDPERNRLKWGRAQAAFARPEYDAWWRFWEEEGWVSLGRTKGYDWMHVQAAKF